MTGFISSHQQVLVTIDTGRKCHVSNCSQLGPARCLTAKRLACSDSQALGLPGGWVAGQTFCSLLLGLKLPTHHSHHSINPDMTGVTVDPPHTALWS